MVIHCNMTSVAWAILEPRMESSISVLMRLLKIEQFTPTVSVVDNGGTYSGTAFPATATVNGQSSLEGVTPTLDYQQYINGVWTDLGTNAPVNAGSLRCYGELRRVN